MAFFDGVGSSSGVGWGSVSSTNNGGSGIVSALENIGVNFAAGAATIGLGALSRTAGVSSGLVNPAAVAFNSSILTRRPGSFSPIGAAFGVSGNTLLFAGVLVVGLLVFAATRKRG